MSDRLITDTAETLMSEAGAAYVTHLAPVCCIVRVRKTASGAVAVSANILAYVLTDGSI